MGKTTIVIFLCFLQFHQFLSMVESQVPLAPALYIFGDSVVDGGNNNDLNTYAKANYLPYGVDFPISVTGRFTNGLTITDFLGKSEVRKGKS